VLTRSELPRGTAWTASPTNFKAAGPACGSPPWSRTLTINGQAGIHYEGGGGAILIEPTANVSKTATQAGRVFADFARPGFAAAWRKGSLQSYASRRLLRP